MKMPKIGDIKWLKKPNEHGHTWKKFENVTKINMETGRKKELKKWVSYW